MVRGVDEQQSGTKFDLLYFSSFSNLFFFCFFFLLLPTFIALFVNKSAFFLKKEWKNVVYLSRLFGQYWLHFCRFTFLVFFSSEEEKKSFSGISIRICLSRKQIFVLNQKQKSKVFKFCFTTQYKHTHTHTNTFGGWWLKLSWALWVIEYWFFSHSLSFFFYISRRTKTNFFVSKCEFLLFDVFIVLSSIIFLLHCCNSEWFFSLLSLVFFLFSWKCLGPDLPNFTSPQQIFVKTVNNKKKGSSSFFGSTSFMHTHTHTGHD